MTLAFATTAPPGSQFWICVRIRMRIRVPVALALTAAVLCSCFVQVAVAVAIVHLEGHVFLAVLCTLTRQASY